MAMNDLMTRMNRIFEGLVGCKLEFQPANELSSDQWNAQDLELFKSERASIPQYVESSDTTSFGFPINMHGAFAGLAVVRGVQNSGTRNLLLLAEMFTMVLETGLRQEERRERLRLIEERLHTLEENSNVIPLRPARFGRVLQVVDTETTSEHAQPSPLTTMPLLIETKPGFPLHRVAVEIHHLSRRWAFISVDDLPAEIFQTRESLQQLGSVTLFIRDIAQLTTAQQIKLAEYLAVRPSGDMPHIVAGSNASVKELEETGRVLPSLLKLFCSSSLQWTDKTPEQVTTELINASLRHILEQTRQTHAHGEHFIPFHIQYFDPEQPHMH